MTNNKLIIANFEVYKIVDRGSDILLILNVTCGLCKKKIRVNKYSKIIQLNQKQIIYRCPYCNVINKNNIQYFRKYLWDFFLDFLSKKNTNFYGFLSCDDARAVLEYAIALSPYALIRFGSLWHRGVGHLIENTAIYLEYKTRGLLPPSLDFIGIHHDTSMINSFLLKKWKKILQLNQIGAQLWPLVRNTPLEIKELTWYAGTMEWDPYCIMQSSNPPICFTQLEMEKAYSELSNMGIPPDASFVCLFVRDDSFDSKVRKCNNDSIAQYSSRNANIDNYKLGAQFLVSQGYYVLRMGSIQQKSITWTSDKIIDYSTHHRSEFMDVWLFCNCSLAVGTSSGMMSLPSVLFNKPCLFTDYPHICWEPLIFMNDILILPKTPFYKNGNRITIHEYVEKKMYKCNVPHQIGIYLNDNSPEEILLALRQRISMLRGTYSPTKLIQKLQNRHLKYVLETSNFSHAEKNNFMNIIGRKEIKRTTLTDYFLLQDYEAYKK